MSNKAARHSGMYYINAAEKAGLRTEPGKGSHTKVYGPAGRGYQTIPHHKELDRGLENKIRKWLMALGVVLIVVLMCYQVSLVTPYLAGAGW